MAFFDDLGKKLSQAGQTAVQKTKEMTDIARINSMISDEEKKANNNYFQVGKLYVSLHQNDYEGDFAGLISAIQESENKIKEYKQQIQDIKGVVRCEKCGAEVGNNTAFCSSCGAPVQKEEPVSNQLKCSGCGAIIDKNMRFCTSCGKPTAESVQAETPVEQTTPEAVAKKCPNCQIEVADNISFCTECGTKLN